MTNTKISVVPNTTEDPDDGTYIFYEIHVHHDSFFPGDESDEFEETAKQNIGDDGVDMTSSKGVYNFISCFLLKYNVI